MLTVKVEISVSIRIEKFKIWGAQRTIRSVGDGAREHVGCQRDEWGNIR